jgi:TRAP-type transport system periplasmic protein
MRNLAKGAAIAAFGLAFGFGGMIVSSEANAETVIRYSPWLPAQHSIHEGVIRPWIAQVEAVTEGRVKVEFLPAAVGRPAEQYDVVTEGLADMGVILPGYTPGRFPLLDLGEMALLSDDAAVLGPAFYRIYTEHLADIDLLSRAHVLTIFATTPNHVVTNTKIIESLSDFQGLRMRAPTAASISIIDAIGAVPVQRPVSEMYELASTGIVDGTFFASTAVVDWNLEALLPYMTRIPGGIGQPTMAFLINQEKWDSISEEDRSAIMKISGEALAAVAGGNYAASETAARDKLLNAGVTIEPASDQLLDELREALAPVEAQWVEAARGAGLADPAAVLEQFRADLAAAEAAKAN